MERGGAVELRNVSASFSWESAAGGGNEQQDEVWLLDSFNESQREEMQRIFSSLDSTRDGVVDKTSLESGLSSLGLGVGVGAGEEEVDLSSLVGIKTDEAGFRVFESVVRVHLAFQRIGSGGSGLRMTGSSVTAIIHVCPLRSWSTQFCL